MNLKEYLLSLKVQELRDICKKSGIIGITKLKKLALVETMIECELKDTGFNPIVNMSDIVPPTIIEGITTAACCHGSDDPLCDDCDPIILHLPFKPDALKVNKEKWLNMFKKGKEILKKNKL
tara:strand:- start:24 stop:389 length:366 start_codon:yes stop_codon:yes gene_type:complete